MTLGMREKTLPRIRRTLFREQARLVSSCRGCRRFAARDSYHAEHSDFRKSAARNKNAIGCGVQVGRRNLQAIVEQREKIVGHHALKSVAVREAQAYP